MTNFGRRHLSPQREWLGTTTQNHVPKFGHICGASVDDLRIMPSNNTYVKDSKVVVCLVCHDWTNWSSVQVKFLYAMVKLKEYNAE